VHRPTAGWNLSDFEDHLDRWIRQESPTEDLRVAVAHWLLSRIEDPYQGMRREPDGHPNLWFGMIPGTRHGNQAVYCSFLIFEQTGTVRCNSIATLSWPA
jgi:hypothetical protein